MRYFTNPILAQSDRIYTNKFVVCEKYCGTPFWLPTKNSLLSWGVYVYRQVKKMLDAEISQTRITHLRNTNATKSIQKPSQCKDT